ncbi:glycosyltransferase family 2 protein [Micromonospora arida]
MYTIVIPAKNEEATIGEVVETFRAVATTGGAKPRCIVVNDGSTDATPRIAEKAGAKVVTITSGSGLANVFRVGISAFLESGSKVAIHVDADGQYLADDVGPMLAAFSEQRTQLVLGDRLWRQPDGMSSIRYDWNISLSNLVSTLARTHISDSQTGFRVMGRELAKRVTISGAYTYTQEQIVRAARSGFQIASVPITFLRRPVGHSRLMRSPFSYMARVMEQLGDVAEELDLDVESTDYIRRT